MGKKKERASKHIDFESDNEELQDEVGQFYNDKFKVDKKSYRRSKEDKINEVLNVEGDLSGDESDEEEDGSGFSSDDGITENKWGRKRKEYYGASYVDEDYGGMREEELEEAELEEEDVIARQKLLDKVSASVADLMDDDEEEISGKKLENTSVEVEEKWSLKEAKKQNKQFNELVTEYNQRKELMCVIVQPLEEIIPKLPKNSVIAKQILLAVEVYANYLMNLIVFLKMKSNSFASKKIRDEILDLHPVQAKLAKLKSMISKVDEFLGENSDALKKLQTVESTDELATILSEVKLFAPKKKQVEVPAIISNDSQEMEDGDDMEEGEDDERRPASHNVAKNALSQKSKKKKNKTSKTANRRKFETIKKKVRSQVGVIRKENSKYTGEARGIRASTIKSTKLLA